MNSLPIFQANFPSKSHESTSKQQTQPSSLQASNQPISIPNQMPVQSAPLMVSQMPSMPNQLSGQCISAPLIQPPIPSIPQPHSQVSAQSIPQANNQAPATSIPQPASQVQVSMPSISQSTSQQPSPPSSPPPNQLRLRSPSPFHQLPRGQPSPTTDQQPKQNTRPSTHLPLRNARPLPTQQHVQTTPPPQAQLSLRRASTPSSQLPVQSATAPNQVRLQFTAPNQMLSPTPPQKQSTSSSPSNKEPYIQLQTPPSHLRLTDTAETFYAALNNVDVSADFLLDDFDNVPTTSRTTSDTTYSEEDLTDKDVFLHRITALEEENSKLRKENEELRGKVASPCRHPGNFTSD